MAEDSTRRLLKVFGVAMTDCEDALAALTTAARDPASAAGGDVTVALETYGKAARDLSARWTEVSRLILDYHARAQEAVLAHLAARRGS